MHLIPLLIVFDKVGKPTERNRQKTRSKLAGQLVSRTIWYNGGHKEKPASGFDIDVLSYISIISDRRLYDGGTRLN